MLIKNVWGYVSLRAWRVPKLFYLKNKDKYRWSDGRKYLPGIGRGFGSDASAGEGFM